MAGLEDIRLSLRSDEIVEGEEAEIIGEVEARAVTSKSGGQYKKYIVPVKLESGERNLWLMESEAGKIARACGAKLKDYIGATLILGIQPAEDSEGNPINTKEGKPVTNVVIKAVKK